MTINRYNKSFVYLEESKNVTKNEKSIKKTNLIRWETKILKI